MPKTDTARSSQEYNKLSFWKTVAAFHIYFIFFYILVLIVLGRFTVSALVLTIPVLIIAMVPLVDKGLRAYRAKSTKNEIMPAIGFLLLFTLAKLIILASLHERLEAFYIIDLEASAINLVVAGFFILIAALSVFFFFTTKSWINRFIFIILIVYSLARILNSFDVMTTATGWILQYLTLIALPLILLAIFIKAKLSKQPD